MVVHLEDAEFALAAVVGSYRLPGLFANALLTVFDFHVLTLERGSHTFLDATRASKRSPQVTQVRHDTAAIEGDKVEETFHGERNALNKLVFKMVFWVPVKDVGAVSHVLPVHN